MEESGRIKGLSMYYESNFEYLKSYDIIKQII